MGYKTGSTLPLLFTEEAWQRPRCVPCLFLVTPATRGGEVPLRLSLADLDEVKLARGAQRHICNYSTGSGRSLDVGIVDSWMSSAHATLVRDVLDWKLVDNDSTNGTKVNGLPCRATTLRDGDLIEMGRTFFLFRAAVMMAPDAPHWTDAHGVDARSGLATLSPVLAQRFGELARLAATTTSILLQGPTGSGKEVLARAVHTLSGRSGRFVAVNCAGLHEALIESELFGHKRGAFAGATCDRDGLIAASAGGTLFLDEIGDLPLGLQGRLLRVLDRALRPVGRTTEVSVDLRIVCATHRDLGRLVEEGKFRHDLLSRLGSRFELPPLRDRREDMGLAIDTVLQGIADPRARSAELSIDATRQLLSHSWPGNLRELQKALEHAVALADGAQIAPWHLPVELQVRPQDTPCPIASAPRAPAMPAPDPFAYDAFISYRHEDPVDRTWVELVMVPRLEQLGLRLCLEHRDLEPGEPLISELERAIGESRYTVAVLTPSYLDGGFERLHSLLGQHQGWEMGVERFIPIMRRPCRPALGVRAKAVLDFGCEPEVEGRLQRLAEKLRRPPPTRRASEPMLPAA